jgi:hypothetical protein
LHDVFVCISNSCQDTGVKSSSQRFETIYVRFCTGMMGMEGYRTYRAICTNKLIM